ncbi:NAD(P)H-binding protein [Lacticaseibacillus brantae]|uniref:Quinone oxidoreductase 2 n=1 Tax=Lacticaseibacillus brantae DSM 23927 TaxID=1423727 RepID=A0A0R2AY03_9LACO|nr:NAD(P)H-binding protein [Lacticaseibacillus brantae]KRM72241.1 quinone oxidoreductase 2 [Lacticaseibacillus brantae DSM 23927]
MKYAISGATGRFGQTAIKTLIQTVPAADIVALARNTDKAKQILPAGVDVRPGAYEDLDQLTKSLNGVDKLLFISSQPGAAMSRPDQHQNLIQAAKAAGVKFIAYTSFPHAQSSSAALASDHQFTEKAIEASGIDHSFLRNDWYLENEADVLRAGQSGQPFVYSAGNGRVGWALEHDYAQAAAKVLLLDQPKAIYELAGQPYTYAELADALATATGAKFEVLSVSDADYEAGLKQAGLDDGTAALVTSFQTLIRDGNLDVTSNDLPDILGRPLPSLVDAVKQVLGL